MSVELVERAVMAVLDAEGVEEAEISVAFLDDAGITRLNRTHLGHEGPTDVISFALEGPDGTPLGDVYVGAEQARRQAAELGISTEEEFVRLVVHGVLHVLGHDHPDGEERSGSPMYRLQERLVAELTRRS